MAGHPIPRAVAVLAAVALTVSLAGTALAEDVDPAAKKRVVKCDGKVATKVGTAGNDRLVGTPKRDIIAGLGGNDTILGLGGNDLICGGAGHDRIFGGPGPDKVLGQTGRDIIRGGTGHDQILGGAHADVLAGQGGRDLLYGGPGNDRLVGGAGIDTCYQNTGQGAVLQCELPVPPPPPPPDGDGDGVPDSNDWCPNKGDRGHGVTERGCPIFVDFQTACEEWGGTYAAGPVVRPSPSMPVTLAPVCDWASTDEATWSHAISATRDLCPSGSYPLNLLNLYTGEAHVGCREYPADPVY